MIFRKIAVQASLVFIALLVLLGFAFKRVGSVYEIRTFFLLMIVTSAVFAISQYSDRVTFQSYARFIFIFWAASTSVVLMLLLFVPTIYESDLFNLAMKQGSTGVFDFSISSINYPGAIYFYGFIFAIFGSNPLVIVLVNSLFIFLTSIMLYRVFIHILPLRGKVSLGIFILLALPQVLVAETQIGKEVLVIFLSTLILFFAWQLCSSTYKSLVLLCSGLFSAALALALVRTSALIVVTVSVFIIFLLTYRKHTNRWKFLSVAALILIITTPIGYVLSGIIGGYQDLTTYASTALAGNLNEKYFPSLEPTDNFIRLTSPDYMQTGNVNTSPSSGWSENSIGELLTPETTTQVILYTAPRSLLNLTAPLGSKDSWYRAIEGNDIFKVEYFASLVTSVLVLLALPLMAGSVHSTFKTDGNLRCLSFFWVPALVVILTISAGTILIHERYRLLALPFLVASAVAGWATTGRPMKKRLYTDIWTVILFGGVLIFVYKYL